MVRLLHFDPTSSVRFAALWLVCFALAQFAFGHFGHGDDHDDQQIMPGTFGLRRTNFGSRTESRAGERLRAHNLLQINESVKTLIEGDQQVFIYRRWFVLQKVPEASIISNNNAM
jgi:hypothetical protein